MIPLIGYTDKLSARPGDTIACKISSRLTEDYSAKLVRLICADPNPDGPGIIEESVEAHFTGTYPSREQAFHPGSCALIDTGQPFTLESFTLTALIWPTLPGTRQQCILSFAHTTEAGAETCQATLFIDDQAQLGASLGDSTVQRVALGDTPLIARQWYRVWMCFDSLNNTLSVGFKALNTPRTPHIHCAEITPPAHLALNKIGIASRCSEHPLDCFNGKIEAPAIYPHACTTSQFDNPHQPTGGALAQWDFSQHISRTRIIDTGPHQLHGELRNFPARGMTGARWDGTEMAWRHAPQHYAAIHFHSDDIVDFGWDTDFSFTLPEALPSGIYAVRIRCGEYQDNLPFFVCPPKNQRRADLCVLVSTFTYTVYGNHARPDFHPDWKARIDAWNAYPWNPAEHPEYGLSTYNHHHDGSGICHASSQRPLLNLRAGYLTFGYGEGSGLRHFQADSHLIAWLENKHHDYDIITDWELHQEGHSALEGYKAVTTGSHPEYHTQETLDALQQYRDNGGKLMYLGGNGFYWRVALHSEHPNTIEIRRGEGGIRAWASEPGEYYNAFDGHYGGLWWRNGRPPQQLAAVGFSGQGQFQGSYYRPAAGADAPAAAWILAGIDDTVLGDFGLSGGGAAGFELDRADTRLGTPENAIVIARSEGHDDSFILVPEEQLTHITVWPGGKAEDAIRADMTYCEYPGGGAVFASGSITFCGSLPHNNFNNNISDLLDNVINRFLH